MAGIPVKQGRPFLIIGGDDVVAGANTCGKLAGGFGAVGGGPLRQRGITRGGDRRDFHFILTWLVVDVFNYVGGLVACQYRLSDLLLILGCIFGTLEIDDK